MKTKLLLTAICFYGISVLGQVVPNIDFITFPPAGGTREMIDNVPSALDITNNAEYISGYTKNSVTLRDYLLIKYDINGNIVWQKTFDYAGLNDRALAIAIDGTGNIYITGEATSVSNGTDIVTRKYDLNGNLIWSKVYNGTANADDKGLGIAVDNSGNVFVCGYSSNAGTGKDFLVLCYNVLGVQQYAYTKNGTANGDDAANAIVFFGNKLYVTGNLTNTGKGTDIYSTRLNSNNASVNWSKTENGTANSNDQGLDIKVQGNDVLICGGVTNTGTNQDYFFAKYNATNGTNLFTPKTYDAFGGNDFATSLVLDASNTYAITGLAQNGSNYDYHTVKYDNGGIYQWTNKHLTNANFLNVYPKISVDNIANHFYVSGVTYQSSIDAAIYQITPGGNETWADYYDRSGLRDANVDLSVDNLGRIYVATLSEITSNIFDVALIRYSQTPVAFPPDYNSEPAQRAFAYLANKGQLLDNAFQPVPDIKFYTTSGNSLFYIRNTDYSIVNQRSDTAKYNGSDTVSRIDVSFLDANKLTKVYNFENYSDISNF